MANPPKMSRAEVTARAATKRKLLLDFLASGEVWTTIEVVELLLQCSRRSAMRTIDGMARDKLIKADDLGRDGRLWGITNHGLGLADTPTTGCREFFIGKTNHSHVNHHVQTQLARLRAEAAGWTEWVPGKLLYAENAERLQKVPDALSTSPDGLRVAVEVELYIKSQKRMAEIVAAYLAQIKDGKHDVAHYVSPHPQAMQRALDSVQFVAIGSNKIKVSDAHRQRFRVSALDDFPQIFKGA